MGHELHFFPDKRDTYVALQGVHALASPGLYPLTIQGTLPSGAPFAFSQLVEVSPGDFYYETLEVNPETIDPANTGPEDELWNSIPVKATEKRRWAGLIHSPVSPLFADCFPSYYGTRRSYNGSEFKYFHTGLDFCTGSGSDIYAVAAGTVVYTGSLTVRGNATIIDHGWGVFSAYMHQSEILVEEGDQVEAGQLIGLSGGTGRVTGAHLHLEIWVGGVQVNPMDWLQREFP
jgi:murein DD-endopeptidase MepM/ murein hydrolase activator NlpD